MEANGHVNAITRAIRNLVANSLIADGGPYGQHVGQHLSNAAGGGDGDPVDVAMVAWEQLGQLVTVDVEWLDYPTWHQWSAIVDAAKRYLDDQGHLEFSHYANGAPLHPTRLVHPPEVPVNAWIRRVRADVQVNDGAMSVAYLASDEWGPAFSQVASVRSAYPATVLADAMEGREPTDGDLQYLFIGMSGQPITGFRYPVPARLPIEMIAK